MMAEHHAPTSKVLEAPPANRALYAVTDRLRRIDAVKSIVLRTRRWRTTTIDRWLNISTPYPDDRGHRLDTRFGDAVPNEPVDYLLLRRFIKPLKLSANDVLYDVGCGMGRVLCVFARRPIAKCIGIEFDSDLAARASENAARLRGRRAQIEIRCCDAVDANYDEGTIYWFFNPFGERTFGTVIERIEHSVTRQPRHIRIVYVNPLHEDVLHHAGWLQRAGYSHSPFFGKFGASYWESALHPNHASHDKQSIP